MTIYVFFATLLRFVTNTIAKNIFSASVLLLFKISITRTCLNLPYMFVNVHIQYLLCFKNTIANVQHISPVFPFKMSSCQSMAKQQMGSVEFQYLPKRQSLSSLKRVAGCASAALLTSFSCYTLWVDVSLKSHETQYKNFSVKNCGLVAFLNIQIVVVLFKKTELFKN